MTTTPLVVGVDVAKDRLDVAVRPRGETRSVANDEAGITALVTRLRPLGPALIVCEATGGFERAAIAALAVAGCPLSSQTRPKCGTSSGRPANVSARQDGQRQTLTMRSPVSCSRQRELSLPLRAAYPCVRY